jgi:hypothetical protein
MKLCQHNTFQRKHSTAPPICQNGNLFDVSNVNDVSIRSLVNLQLPQKQKKKREEMSAKKHRTVSFYVRRTFN